MPLDKVNDEFLKLKRAYGHVFSGDALALILRYVEQMRCRLDEIAQPDKVSEGLGIGSMKRFYVPATMNVSACCDC